MDKTPLLGQSHNQVQKGRTFRLKPLLLLPLVCLSFTFWTYRATSNYHSISSTSVTSRPPQHQPIAGAFEFHPSLYSHIFVLVENANEGVPHLTAKPPMEISAQLVVDPGTSDNSHAAFEISSSLESAQRESSISATVDEGAGILTIKLVLDDSYTSTYAKPPVNKKNPWLHAKIRITLPQAYLASFRFVSNSSAIDSSLVWEADTRVDDFVAESLGSNIKKNAKKASSSLVLNSALEVENLVLVTRSASISVKKASARSVATIASATGDIDVIVRQTPILDVSSETGTVRANVDYADLNGIVHETSAHSVSGLVRCKVVGFNGKFKAATDNGIVKVSVAHDKKNKVVTIDNTEGWVGEENGKGLLHASSKTGNVALYFL
ncbi:UNVERIFIED_CONTAM: hypothetical protein HDU68_002589 [Siphonaria sp. JEL0065]|nr:hypothetical protein HDU68_002589 [Siphonaria sp. JEL0065]